MTIKVLNAMKKPSYFSLLLLFFVACENDINTIDAGFIGDEKFTNVTVDYEVSFDTENIDRIKSTALGQYLLGVYNDPEFGALKASFVSQLGLPSNVKYYTGKEFVSDTIVTPILDSVVLYVPYQSTLKSIDSDTKVKTFELDSVYGLYNKTTKEYGSFHLKVHKLNTFLSSLDPTDPSQSNTYYTDKNYDLAADGLLADIVNFKPSASDTVTIIERKIGNEIYDRDTIRLTNGTPRMAIPLSKEIFKRDILDLLPATGEDTPSEFSSLANFTRHFKGLYIETVSDDAASIASLKLTDAFVGMYYTNIVKKGSTDAVLDTIKETRTFALGGVKASKFEHDHARLNNDPKNLYIQGAAGSQANVKLLGYDSGNTGTVSAELLGLRNEAHDADGKLKWLINEASLKFYMKEDFLETATDTVFKLFLYKKTPNYNSQIVDYMSSASALAVQGKLTKDKDLSTDDKNIYYYKFLLTDYITNLLETGNTANVDNFGLKVFTQSDVPTAATDTIVTSYNWDPRGVVLHGKESEADAKRVVLKIKYAKE